MKSAWRAMACRSVVKESLPFGGSGASVRRACQRRLRVGHGVADPFFHFRFDVGSNDIDAEMQRARRPATADDSGSEQPERLDFLRHADLASGQRPNALLDEVPWGARLFNVTLII